MRKIKLVKEDTMRTMRISDIWILVHRLTVQNSFYLKYMIHNTKLNLVNGLHEKSFNSHNTDT